MRGFEASATEERGGGRCEPTVWCTAVTAPLPPSVARARVRRLAVGVAIVILLLNLFGPGQPTLGERLLASLLILLACFPTGMWVCGRDRYMPVLPFVSLLYALYYGLPIFLVSGYLQPGCGTLSEASIEYSSVLICAGIAVMFYGYYCPFTGRVGRRLPKLTFEWNSIPAVRSIAILLVVSSCLIRLASFQYLAFSGDPFGPGIPPALQQLYLWLINSSLFGLTMACWGWERAYFCGARPAFSLR